jgi:hypothetical protein
MLLSRTINKKNCSSNNIENPFLVSYRFFSMHLKKMHVVLPSEIFEFLLPPIVTGGRIARCSI